MAKALCCYRETGQFFYADPRDLKIKVDFLNERLIRAGRITLYEIQNCFGVRAKYGNDYVLFTGVNTKFKVGLAYMKNERVLCVYNENKNFCLEFVDIT